MKYFYSVATYNNNGKIINCKPSTKQNLPVFDKDEAKTYDELIQDDKVKEIFFPVDIDTEFQTFNFFNEKLFSENGINTLTLTAQIKPVNLHYNDTFIFNNRQFTSLFPDLKKFPVYKDNLFETFFNKDFDIPKYKIIRERNSNKKSYDKISKKKKLTIVIYGHFLLADFYKIFNGKYLEDVLKDSSGKNPKLIKDKRFHTKDDLPYKPLWFLQDIATDETIPIEFLIVDQCAVYGDASRSLEKMFKALSIDTTTKKSLSQKQKENIINTYRYCFDDFVSYAKNDCRIHECLLKVYQQNFRLYDDLKIISEKPPTLTLGSTTKNTFIERLKSIFNDDNVIEFIKQNSSKQLAKNLSKTLALNAIVNGGRAFNNNPLTFNLKGFILDWDIMSAYVINMLIQPYFFGKCEYYDSSKQRKIKLKTFLNKYGHNFTDRTFQIIISGKLTQNQDYFISNELPNKWYQLTDYSHIEDEEKISELLGIKIKDKEYTKKEKDILDENATAYNLRGDWSKDKSVARKILANELLNSVITYDGLQWIYNHATPKLREEILNCDVITAMFFDKKKEVFDYHELNGENWYRKTVGEIMINEVFKNRKKYNKHDINEKPMNNVFKYLGNSLNGDFMSNLFDISNPIVGNSVCGRTRHTTWLGQSIGTQEIITDGGFLDLLNIIYPIESANYRINSESVCYQKYESEKNHFKQKPLGNIKSMKYIDDNYGVEITLDDGEIKTLIDERFNGLRSYIKRLTEKEILNIKAINIIDGGVEILFEDGNKEKVFDSKMSKARNYIDELLAIELRKIFPYDHLINEEITLPHNNQIIKGIVFESKGIVNNAISHGQANYSFSGGYHENFNSDGIETKMRSYCLKFRQVREILNDFLMGLSNKNSVIRSKPFLISQIISPKIYAVRSKFFEEKNLIIGDTIYKPCFFKECSLSSFHFRNLEQYTNFIKKQQSLKNRYGQSFEMFFENEDLTLNYEDMMKYIYELIYKGEKEFIKPIKKPYKQHPYYEQFLRLKYFCDYEYGSKNQTLFLEDLTKEFDFEIVDVGNIEEIIKSDCDLKNDFDLDDLIDDLMIA